MTFQEFTEEAPGSTFVLAALHEDTQDVTILVDGTSKILVLALNRDGPLIVEPVSPSTPRRILRRLA